MNSFWFLSNNDACPSRKVCNAYGVVIEVCRVYGMVWCGMQGYKENL